jgi:hypothetical protein
MVETRAKNKKTERRNAFLLSLLAFYCTSHRGYMVTEPHTYGLFPLKTILDTITERLYSSSLCSLG